MASDPAEYISLTSDAFCEFYPEGDHAPAMAVGLVVTWIT